jgi:hypothetical protein
MATKIANPAKAILKSTLGKAGGLLTVAPMVLQGIDANKQYPGDQINQMRYMAGVIGNPEEQKRKFIEWQNQNVA